MAKIHVVTDSGSDLSKDLLEKHGITVVPLTIQFGDDIYKDGVELGAQQFYEKLSSSSVLPSTCQPSPADFVAVYEKLAQPGDTIISVHLSSKLSGTYQSAVLAGTMLPDIEVIALDSRSASLGIGFVAIAAAEAVKNGATKDEAVAAAQRVAEELRVYFVVDTLEYLQKNGRIGRAQAMVGTLLNIKPILTLEDGVVTPFDKVRGKTKALRRIQDLVEEYAKENADRQVRMGIVHANCAADARKIGEGFGDSLKAGEQIFAFIGPTIGVHVGPGTIALLFHPM